MTKWTAADIPDQSGRTVIVTGSNSGLGAVTARDLARAGARVIMACRNLEKANAVADTIDGNTEVRQLDLSDLASVRRFVDELEGDVDVLVNNAGIMAVPFRRTGDGFESQIGTNHLGPFALTGLLINRITDRVVTVSSAMHQVGRIRQDLNFEQGRYQRWLAYGQTKLANLLFAYELQRRLEEAGSDVISVAAHPGYAATELQSHTDTFQDKVMAFGNRLFAQSADMGALPSLYAATMPGLPGGSYWGPDGFQQQRGYPKRVGSNAASRDQETAARLWDVSERLTGVTYKIQP